MRRATPCETGAVPAGERGDQQVVEFNKGAFRPVPWTEVDVAMGLRRQHDSCWVEATVIAVNRINGNPGNYRPQSNHDDMVMKAAEKGLKAIKNVGKRVMVGIEPPLDCPSAYLAAAVGNALPGVAQEERGEKKKSPKQREIDEEEKRKAKSPQHWEAEQPSKLKTESLDATAEQYGDRAGPADNRPGTEEQTIINQELEDLLDFFTENDIVPGSLKWDCTIGREKGVAYDEIAAKHNISGDKARKTRERTLAAMKRHFRDRGHNIDDNRKGEVE
jgi:hypothetical protein